MQEEDVINGLIEAETLEELNSSIQFYIKNGFNAEECIYAIIENYYENYKVFKQFILDTILNGSEDYRRIVLQNLDITLETYEILGDNRIKQYLMNNFESAFKYLSYESRDDFIKELMDSKDGIEFIKDKIIRCGLINSIKISTRNFIFDRFSRTEKGLEFIINNLKQFFTEKIDRSELYTILRYRAGKERIIEERQYILKRLYNEELVTFMKWLAKNNVDVSKEISLDEMVERLYSNIKDKKALETIRIIYKELLERRKPKCSEMDWPIEYLGSGIYNEVYGVGDFVVKIGTGRQTPYIQYHRRILQPLLRQEITGKFLYSNGEDELDDECSGVFVEIQNKVDTNWYKNLSKERIYDELYEIYKDFRMKGIIWTDVFEKNVGRLLRKNTTNFPTKTLKGKATTGKPIYNSNGETIGYQVINSKELKEEETEMIVSDKAVGITGRIEEPPLEKGKLVLLDVDFLYLEDEIDIEEDRKEVPPLKYLRFEDRYLAELKDKEER